METLQHFLIFLIQFTFFSGISAVTIAFVNYVTSPQLIADDLIFGEDAVAAVEAATPVVRTVETSNDNETTIIVDRVSTALSDQEITKPETESELLCMEDEAIEQTVRQYQNIEPANLSQIESNDLLAKTLGIKQKVNSKDAPKSWLIKQIEQKLKEQPDITEVVL
jgi:hypothetical protein